MGATVSVHKSQLYSELLKTKREPRQTQAEVLPLASLALHRWTKPADTQGPVSLSGADHGTVSPGG